MDGNHLSFGGFPFVQSLILSQGVDSLLDSALPRAVENRVVVLSQKDGVLRFKISNTKSGLLLNLLLVLLILFCVAFPSRP